MASSSRFQITLRQQEKKGTIAHESGIAVSSITLVCMSFQAVLLFGGGAAPPVVGNPM